MVNWTLVVASFGAVVATFDIYWFLRLAYTRLVSFVRKPMAITDVSRIIYNLLMTGPTQAGALASPVFEVLLA